MTGRQRSRPGRRLRQPPQPERFASREQDLGLGPAARAAVGMLLGAACGAFTLTVLPRRPAAPTTDDGRGTEGR